MNNTEPHLDDDSGAAPLTSDDSFRPRVEPKPATASSNKTSIIVVLGGLITLALFVGIIVALIFTSPVSNDHAPTRKGPDSTNRATNLEATLDEWFTAVENRDLESFEKRTHPVFWEHLSPAITPAYLESLSRNPLYPSGVETIEFASTDLNEIARWHTENSRTIDDSEVAVEAWAWVLADTIKRGGFDPAKYGLVVFSPDHSAKELPGISSFEDDQFSLAWFDLSKTPQEPPLLVNFTRWPHTNN